MISLETIEETIRSLPINGAQRFPHIDTLCAQILWVLSNPEIYNPLLQELNTAIATKVVGQSLPDPNSFSFPEWSEYQSIRATQLPIPNAQNPVPDWAFQYLHALEAILLETEQANGINIGRRVETVPTFVGPVPEKDADALVCKGGLWNDEPFDLLTFFHGKISHRVQVSLVYLAIKEGIIKVEDSLRENFPQRLVFEETKIRFVFETIQRTYWNLAFENNNMRQEKGNILEVIQKKCTKKIDTQIFLCGPANLMSALLSKQAYQQHPHLSVAIYAALMQSMLPFWKMDRAAFNECITMANTLGPCEADRRLIEAINQHRQNYLNDKTLTQYSMPGSDKIIIAGIRYQTVCLGLAGCENKACLTTSKQTVFPELKTCTRCHRAQYCSLECQRVAWTSHKSFCKS